MYKNDIREALTRIALVTGGAVEGLLDQIRAAEAKLSTAYAEIAANNDTSIKAGCAHLQEAIRPITQRLTEISPTGTAVELHQLGTRFDGVLKDYPELEELLRPGRQATAALAGAFDLVLQQNRRPPSVIGLIAPGASLASCYVHYETLERLLTESIDARNATDSSARIEIEGADRLGAFANYMILLSHLADIAKWLVDQAEVNEGVIVAPREIRIASIESGSPIQINLNGNSKALRLLLVMLRDVIRVPYLHLSIHGRTIQAMETFARAKELGIGPGPVLDQLEEAMVQAAGTYANSFQDDSIAVTINGEHIRDSAPRSLPAPDQSGTDESTIPMLSGPSE
jgi:hypothetical protein